MEKIKKISIKDKEKVAKAKDNPKCIIEDCKFHGNYLGTPYCSQCIPQSVIDALPYGRVAYVMKQREEAEKRSGRIILNFKKLEESYGKFWSHWENKKDHPFHPQKVKQMFVNKDWKELIKFMEYYCNIDRIIEIPMMKSEEIVELSNIIYQDRFWLQNINLIRGIDSLLINMTWDYYRLNRPGFKKFPGECLCYLCSFGDIPPISYDNWISMKQNSYSQEFNSKNKYYLKNFILQKSLDEKFSPEIKKECFLCLDNVKLTEKTKMISCCGISVYHLECEKDKIKKCPICRKSIE